MASHPMKIASFNGQLPEGKSQHEIHSDLVASRSTTLFLAHARPRAHRSGWSVGDLRRDSDPHGLVAGLKYFSGQHRNSHPN